jgi:hypothetical protein
MLVQTWSFSGLKEFINCPRQYNEVKNLKNYTKKVTEQMLYGTEVHKALEDYVRDGVPLAKNYERYKPLVDPLLEIEGVKFLEYQMALRKDLSPCAFDAPDYWVRGIADFMVVDGDTAFIVDYKTGSAKYPDKKQLVLMSLMAFANFPEVQKVKAGLLFVAYNMFVDNEYERQQIPHMWAHFIPHLERLRVAAESNNWMPNPTPLCGWCPVKTCQYQKR